MQAIGMKYRYSYKELWQPKNFMVTFRMYQLNLDGCEDRIYRKYWDRYPHFIKKRRKRAIRGSNLLFDCRPNGKSPK